MQERRILFVCVENAGRSQMAEGFFRALAPEGFEAQSAGTVPVSSVNPLAVEAMREVGIDISRQVPKVLSQEMIEGSHRIVNMGCMDSGSCPALFVGGLIEWNIEDPKGKGIEGVRKIRDSIEARVRELVAGL